MSLSKDQEKALVACRQRLEFHGEALLVGAAGTGKTHCMGVLGETVKLMALAPTNAAARVLAGKLPPSIPVSTIHKAAMQLSGQTHGNIIAFWEKLLEHVASDSAVPDLGERNELLSRWNDLEPEHITQCLPLPMVSTIKRFLQSEDLGASIRDLPELTQALQRSRKHNRLIFESNKGQATNAIELLVVDEASMCTNEHRHAIRSAFRGTPVLWVGDDAQLSPVIDEEDAKRGVRPLLELLGAPTARLETQHRQEDGSILLAALERLRSGTGPVRPRLGSYPGMEVIERPKSGITKGLIKRFAEHVGDEGIVIAWRNTTRRNINRELRLLRGIDEWMPQVGERLVVQMDMREKTKESRIQEWLNKRAEAKEVEKERREWDGKTWEEWDEEEWILGWERVNPKPVFPDWTKGTIVEMLEVLGSQPKGNFNELELRCQEVGNGGNSYVVRCGVVTFLETYKAPRMSWALYGDWLLDYSDCVTAHKAQGSEFDQVAIYEERGFNLVENGSGQKRSKFVGWSEHRRWLYTALSRTKKNALLVMQGD